LGIKAVTSEVPLNMTQKWLGHSRIATTAIYTNAMGPEEKQIAERMWVRLAPPQIPQANSSESVLGAYSAAIRLREDAVMSPTLYFLSVPASLGITPLLAIPGNIPLDLSLSASGLP
jgi:hypothetical protein